MAKKYGVGVTAGKKASTYEAIAPDGTKLKKKSFFIHNDTALMGAFEHNGSWMASGITLEKQNWINQIFLPAKKIK